MRCGMPSSIVAKGLLRRQIREKLAALEPKAKEMSDRKLTERFLALPEIRRAHDVLLFRGVRIEPDTLPLIETLWAQGKRVFLPKCLPARKMEARLVKSPEELVLGAFGIPEPGDECPAVNKEALDLILVPALCYDRFRRRLGQGGGYYDRYLTGFSGVTVGLCRNDFLQEMLPWEPHDLPVEIVLTETLRLSEPVPPRRDRGGGVWDPAAGRNTRD